MKPRFLSPSVTSLFSPLPSIAFRRALITVLCWTIGVVFATTLPTFAQDEEPQQSEVSADSYLRYAGKLFTQKKYKDAEKALTQALEKAPNNVEAYYARAVVRYFRDDHNLDGMYADLREAAKFCDKCLRDRMKPNEIAEQSQLSAAVAQGIGYFVLDDFNKASKVLARAQELGSNSPTIGLLLGIARLRMGKIQQGCKDCETAASLGEALAYSIYRDTINAKCGNPIITDPRATQMYVDRDSVAFRDRQFAFVFTEMPRNRQFYQRSTNDSAFITLLAQTLLSGYDSAFVEVLRNKQPYQYRSQPLVYTTVATQASGDTKVATFALQASIHAELSHYTVRIGLKNDRSQRTIAVSDSLLCGDVVVLSGQSNSSKGIVPPSDKRAFMQTYVRSINGESWFPSEETNNRFLFPTSKGKVHNRVGGVGGALQKHLVEGYGVPVCLVQASAQDAAKLIDHVPSGEAIINEGLFSKNVFEQARERLYNARMLDSARSFVWYQGESDGIENYITRFAGLYDTWRKEIKRFRSGYIVQIRPSNCGIEPTHRELRELQRTFAGMMRNTSVLAASAPLGKHDGCHYDDAGYWQLGEQLGRLMARDFHDEKDTLDISSPMIQQAYVSNAAKTEFTLEFSPAPTTLLATADTMVQGKKRRLCDAFSAFVGNDEKQTEKVDIFTNARVEGNRVILQLAKPAAIQSVNYLPNQFYAGTKTVYEGPWLVTKRGVGALSFFKFPVKAKQ